MTLAATATDQATCAWYFGGVPWTTPLGSGALGSFCIITKSQMRAVFGALFLVMGGISMAAGVSLVAAAAALPALEAGAGLLVPIGRARALPGRYSSAAGGSSPPARSRAPAAP